MNQKIDNLPKELTNQPRWIRVREDKTPIDTGWSNPENQNYVSDIESPLKGFDISGHGVSADYFVLDFDHVLNEKGEWINDYAKNVYNWITFSIPTYIERSISKTGFHAIYRPTEGVLSTVQSNSGNNIYFIEGSKDSKIEFFYKTAGRQFVFTGDCEGLCKEQTDIASGVEVDNFIKKLLEESQTYNRHNNSMPMKNVAVFKSNYFKFNPQNAFLWAEDILNLIEVEQLTRSEWVSTGISLKQLGIPFEVFDKWSSQDTGLTSNGKKDRYIPKDCLYQWNSFKDIGDLDVAVGQLINLAKIHNPRGVNVVYHTLFERTVTKMPNKSAQLELDDDFVLGYSLAEYDKGYYNEESAECKKYLSERVTGFETLDKEQALAPSLIIIGAESGVGKTTFCYQLVEQIVQNSPNEMAIYVSYEMSCLEMYSKTLARRTKLAIDDIKNKSHDIPINDLQARKGGTNATVKKVRQEIVAQKPNLRIYEATPEDDITTLLTKLRKSINTIKRENPKILSPIVVIDYLQIMPHESDNHKLGIDDIILRLKTFQRETKTTFIVISSVNRNSYKDKDKNMAAYKETGSIEFSADIAFILNQTDNYTDSPHQLTLKCLKNRFGNRGYSINFDFYGEYDLFVEV